MSDALERLKQRSRPSVKSRDTSLYSGSPDTSISRNQEHQIPENTENQATVSKQPLQTKQSTLRLEQGVSSRLQEVCRENGICREVLIEAMFEFCEANPEFLSTVLSEAITKNEYRQQVANMRRAKSMMQKFS
ncbi:hypothetical protein [Nostoc sp. TCL26-01]|uniref:hypothetical protein n=1 Tax=Nostoc sp. TCL26-01 TaxID=2576904 RepID=UPI0015BCE15F|nr:hypothetical protein [Nostoc sp. TCL26-01]QLE59964.1 hypothetical protein FD725_31615 [Nostoc sp. TCL26-01]